MNDPGDSDVGRLLKFFPKILMMMAVVIILLFFSFMLITNRISTSEIEMNVFYNRLLYSTNALTFYDEDLGRTIFGRIDFDELTTKKLEEAINYPNSYYFAVNITKGGESIYYHKNLYDKLLPLQNLKGPGGADSLEKTITVAEGAAHTRYLINIHILRARS